MARIEQQLQHLTDRFKSYNNEKELKEDLLLVLAQIKENEIIKDAKPKNIGTVVQERIKEITKSSYSGHHLIKTGLTHFDRVFGGLLMGELLVLGARPGMGKTQLVTQLCTSIASQGIQCAMVSLEQSPFSLANRFLSNISGISQYRLIKSELSDSETSAIIKAANILDKLPILIYDQYISSLYSVIEHSKILVQEHHAKVIVIDYIQLINNNHRRYNRETELSIISRELTRLAKTLNICLIVVSQLSRAVESRPGGSKRPQLSDLRESGAIEQDADKVLFIYRSAYYGLEVDENNEPTKGIVELIMAKNKTGPLDTVRIKVDENFTRFIDYNETQSHINISNLRMEDLQ
jgi:replicative DNA helicase